MIRILIAFFIFVSSQALCADEKLKVVTTFTVIADIAQNIAGDMAEVVSITKPGAEIHGYQPTPRDLVRAYGADLILWNGLNLELWFEKFISQLGDADYYTVSEGIETLEIVEGAYVGLPNPHAWMGVKSAFVYIDNIEKALSTEDPQNAQVYRLNAIKYKKKISNIVEPLIEQLQQVPSDKRWLVTCEGAFSYFAKDFGLKELYLWPMNSEQIGTPKQIQKVIDGVRNNKIPVIFCESTVNTRPAKRVAQDTGVAYGGELYVDSLSNIDGPVPTYLDLLRVTSTTVINGIVDNL
jgi:manganese/iron transport system substrate-binding protein